MQLNLIAFFIALAVIYFFFLKTNASEKFDNTFAEQLTNFIKQNNGLNYIAYANFLNTHNNTSLKLAEINTFKKLKNHEQNLTSYIVGQFM
jgi:uncharacterized membrane protein